MNGFKEPLRKNKTMKIHELKYTNTNTYLIRGEKGTLLFDTGWAGTLPLFFRAMGEIGVPVQSIDYILISHFHPDHMGIAQEISDLGPKIAAADLQREFIHSADAVLLRSGRGSVSPIKDEKVRFLSLEESRSFLSELGLHGEILATPGHSDDSISLFLDSGELFVGDLNPLYELEAHKGTETERSWRKLLALKPKKIYYGHAKTADLKAEQPGPAGAEEKRELYALIRRIMKEIDRKRPLPVIAKKTGAAPELVEDVARMYLTHRDVGVMGILDRIEIKGM